MGAFDYTIGQKPRETSDSEGAPDYLRAANIHTIGNSSGISLLDPDSWVDTGKQVFDFATKGSFAAIASGVHSFYNTGVAVNNWFGGDAQEINTADALSNIDSDLGQYYQEHKEGADLAGFIITSFAPGIGGVKVLNAAQNILKASKTGVVGAGLSEATGLLAPTTDKFIRAAANDFIQAQSTFAITNANVVKALAAGTGQAVLESAAFEVAVAATMYKSPVLSSLDNEDMLKNIAVGTVLGGAIGGVFTGIKSFGAIKKSLKTADSELKPVEHIWQFGSDEGMSASDKVLLGMQNLEYVKSAEIKSATITSETVERARARTVKELNNLIRTDVHALTAGKDAETANLMADLLHGMSASQGFKNLTAATEIARAGTPLKTEKLLEAAQAKLGKSGAASYLESGAVKSVIQVGHIKVYGPGAGSVTFGESPKVLSLADTAPLIGGSVAAGVDSAVAAFKFKPNQLWDALTVASHTEAEARYIFASKAPVTSGMLLHENDLPMLERVLDVWNTQSRGLQPLEVEIKNLLIQDSKGFQYPITSVDDLLKHVMNSKDAVTYEYLAGKRAGTGISTEEIAKITNTRLAKVEGDVATDVGADYFAAQTTARLYTDQMIAKGLWKESDGLYKMEYVPTYIKAGYDTTHKSIVDGMELEGMSYLKAKEAMHRTTIDNAVAPILGQEVSQLPDFTDELVLMTNRQGAGADIATSANGGYGTPESVVEQIGKVFNTIATRKRMQIDETFTPLGLKLINNPSAAVEFSANMELVASTGEHYVWNATKTALIPRKLKFYNDDIAAGVKNLTPPKFMEGTPLAIPFKYDESRDLMRAHMEVNLNSYSMNRDLRAAQGHTNEKHLANPNDPTAANVATAYPIKPNPKDFPYIAYVTDDSVTGVGHVKMIHAATKNELAALISKVPKEFSVHTTPETVAFHKAQGDYLYERTLHENYIDTALHRSGAYSRFQPLTDAKRIVEDVIDFHKRQEITLLREAISAKYDKPLTELRRLNESYVNLEASKFKGNVDAAERSTKSPYLTYSKTMLGISNIGEYPLLSGFNNILDSSVSKVVAAVSGAWNSIKSPEGLEEINTIFKKAGLKTSYYDAAMVLHANHTAPKGALTSYVKGVNSIIGYLTLRTDPLNALNNMVGAPVLYGAEVNHLIGGIKSKSPEIAGKLSELIDMHLPGVDEVVRHPGKLLTNAIKAFTSDDPALSQLFKANGWTTTYAEQFKQLLGDAALRGTENATELSKKLNAIFAGAKVLGEKAEKYSGNKLAEEFNRFTAAHTMYQLTNLAQEAGVLTAKESLSYINTFVNRTQGNMLAAQRPLMFQGPVGQAIGLFQTYQFNLMQQMFRHVAEGTSKDAAFLLGLQGTIYGLNGLPAFNFINQHVVGTASGNKEHTDLYDATYGILGKQFGQLATYGIPSNLLGANLYTRGDINPRHPSIVPINPLDVPSVAVPLKAFENIKDMITKFDNGGDVWRTVLQGIEHNGLSRPLAGFAQVAQGASEGKAYSTTSKGNLIYANDLWSVATAARLVGGKPLDEATTSDAAFRITAYSAHDRAKKEDIKEAFKSQVIGTGREELTSEEVQDFAEKYAALGGKQKNFNRWMIEQIGKANTPKVDQIVIGLKGSMSQKMQILMGGDDSTGFDREFK